MIIDGRTAVLVHLAWPSAHLQTPQRFNVAVAARGINAVLVPWQVRPEHLGPSMAALRKAESVAGMIVTIPHKETAALLCDRLEGVADILKVANVIRREPDGTLTGRILDGVGFVRGLQRANVAIAGKGALIVGAGGVALAIAAALIEAGLTRLRIANRTRVRAEAMAERLVALADAQGHSIALELAELPDPEGLDIVINATALGMHEGDPLPLDPARLTSSMTVAEVVMVPRITPLLAAAAARGLGTVPGEAMILDQIDPFIDFVTDNRADFAVGPGH